VTIIVAWLRGLPLPVRWALVGTASMGIIGGTVGLVIGILVYPPTAPFAVVELGLPSAIVGGVASLAAGAVVAAGRRVTRSRQTSQAKPPQK
jgi:hypothetical protein